MKKFLFLLILFCVHLNAYSQLYYIVGTVTDESGKPLSGVEVFLNGTSRLTLTNDEGAFKISRLSPGNYELVAKQLGRDTYTAKFTLTKPSRFNITLKLKRRELTEVAIKPNDYSDADYNTFIRAFLGVTPNASQCKILNPKILNIYRDPETSTLHVNSGGEFLIISNPALGYTVKYLLNEFVLDNQQSYSMYIGQALFTEMTGPASKTARWEKERIKAFLGSPQHLLRSIYHNNLKQQEFIVRRLSTGPNDQNLSERDYVSKKRYYTELYEAGIISRQQHSDSLNLIMKRLKLPVSTSSVGTDTLEANSIISGDQGPNKQLDLSKPLHIIYKGEKYVVHSGHGQFIQGTQKSDYSFQISAMSLREEHQPLIDSYGNLSNPLGVIFNGYMGWERVAEMLPKNFAYDGGHR